MAKIDHPEFVFRGTTEGYPGGKNSQEVPYTCTSWHPLKALWFALECFRINPETACVYIAQMDKLMGLEVIQNCLESIEDEVAFKVKPAVFYAQCDCLIYVPDLQIILADLGFAPYQVVRKDDLTRLCKETPMITLEAVRTVAQRALVFCKKIDNL